MKTSPLNQLQKIIEDKTSGSSDIVLKLNKLLIKNRTNMIFMNTAATKIKNELSHFTVIKDYVNKLSDILNSNDLKNLRDFLDNFPDELQNRCSDLYLNARPYLKKIHKVMTISNSGTLRHFFGLWALDDKKLHVYICESRPGFEGRIFAKSLLKQNIRVNLITEASAANFMKSMDAVITGADSLLKDGSIVNKTGSKILAVLSAYFGIPFYVAAERNKFSGKRTFNQVPENSAEIWNYKNKNLEIKNIYFELVEKDLITAIISDKK